MGGIFHGIAKFYLFIYLFIYLLTYLLSPQFVMEPLTVYCATLFGKHYSNQPISIKLGVVDYFDVVFSLFFHSVHPVTNMTSDTSSSFYIPYIT